MPETIQLPREFSVADLFSLCGILFSLLSISESISGHLDLAIGFIILSLIFDFLDGTLARKFGSSKIGTQLDSFSDFSTSGIAMFFFLSAICPQWQVLFLLIPLFAAIRLAKYNLQEAHDYFEGIPTFLFSLIVIALYGVGLSSSVYFPFVTGLLALSMISGIRISSFKQSRSTPILAPVLFLALLLVYFFLGTMFFWNLVLLGLLIFLCFSAFDYSVCGNAVAVLQHWFLSKPVQITFESCSLLLLPRVHIPATTTQFFYHAIKGRISGNTLEIGTGSGVIPLVLSSLSSSESPKSPRWICTDISTASIENARRNLESKKIPVTFIMSDVSANVTGTYDTILWNFPYFVGSKSLMEKFVLNVGKYLKPGGKAYLASSLVMDIRYPDFEKIARERGLLIKIIEKGAYWGIPLKLYEIQVQSNS